MATEGPPRSTSPEAINRLTADADAAIADVSKRMDRLGGTVDAAHIWDFALAAMSAAREQMLAQWVSDGLVIAEIIDGEPTFWGASDFIGTGGA